VQFLYSDHPRKFDVTTADPADLASETADIDGRLADLPLTRLHVVILVASGFMFGVDLAEMAMGQALSAVFSAGPAPLAAGPLAFLLAAVYIGAVVGAPIAGWVADRQGLQKTLVAVTLWLGVTSLLAAFSPTPGFLTVARLLQGLSLGAYPPLFIAYLSDISPPRQRGRLIFFACALAYVAPPATIFAIRGLGHTMPFGLAGWRWPLLLAGLICLAGGAASFALPEAPRWLASKGRYAAARDVCDRLAKSLVIWRFTSPPPVSPVLKASAAPPSARAARGRLAFVTLLYFLSPFTTIAFPLVTGPILLARGYNLSDTLFYVGLANFGPIIGALLAGLVVDRLRRSSALAVWGGGMLAVLALFFVAPFPAAQVLTVTGFGVLTAIYLPTMTTYGAELFAAPVRARNTSTAWSVNRIGAAIGPLLLLPLARSGHITAVGLILGGSLITSILMVSIRPPKSI
jgi:putative MFS transporter